MSFWDKIISFFNKNQTQIEEEEEAIKELKETQSSIYKHLTKWEDIASFNCHTDKKRLLIMDDYAAVTKIVKEDLMIILKKDYKYKLSKEVIKLIERLKIDINDVEICEISNSLAPYILYKSCDNEDSCKFDFAVIDIIYGDYVLRDNKKFYMDGVDIAKILIKYNPNIKLTFFTGCFLDGMFNTEKDRIISNLGEDFYKNNVLKKTDDREYRIKFLIERLFNEYLY